MLEELKARLRQHEGVVPHLYLDTLGLVTGWVGHMIPNANAMAGVAMVQPGGAITQDGAELVNNILECRSR